MKPSHHRSGGFRNSNPAIVIGNFPWYEMVWRGLRGARRWRSPRAADRFARDWNMPVDRARHAARQLSQSSPLGHVTVLCGGRSEHPTDPTLAGFADLTAALVRPHGARAADAARLPPIDLVLVSHNHYDHLCDATIAGWSRQTSSPAFSCRSA
jgi:hypothetical protein